MNSEGALRFAFWGLLGLMLLMRVWFASRLRQSGERLLPDRAAIQREPRVFALRCLAFLFLIALVVILCIHPNSFNRLSIPLPYWLRWAGLVLGLASLALWTWTHLALGRFWSAQLQLRPRHRLITTGPYSRMRHPMYTAILGWLVGLGLVIANWIPLIFVACGAVLILMRVPAEEQMMLTRFGDEYREYMKRTGKFLPAWHASRQIRQCQMNCADSP